MAVWLQVIVRDRWHGLRHTAPLQLQYAARGATLVLYACAIKMIKNALVLSPRLII